MKHYFRPNPYAPPKCKVCGEGQRASVHLSDDVDVEGDSFVPFDDKSESDHHVRVYHEILEPQCRHKTLCRESQGVTALEYARGQHAERKRTVQLIGEMRKRYFFGQHGNVLDRLVEAITSKPLPNIGEKVEHRFRSSEDGKFCLFKIDGFQHCGLPREAGVHSAIDHRHCTADGKHSPECVMEQLHRQRSGHVLMTPETCGLCHSAHASWPNCPVCVGGLAVCLKCGEFEAGLDAPCRFECEDVTAEIFPNKSDVARDEMIEAMDRIEAPKRIWLQRSPDGSFDNRIWTKGDVEYIRADCLIAYDIETSIT